MTALDTKFRLAASKNIAKYGKVIQCIRSTQGAYNAATATVVNITVTSPVSVVIEEWAQSRRYADGKFATGIIIGDGDKILTIAALNYTKNIATDKFVIDGVTFTVPEDGVAITYSGELPCLYQVVARNA